MKRLFRSASGWAGLAVSTLILLGGCAQQDPAARVTLNGQYLFPGNADALVLDVYDSGAVFFHKRYALDATMKFPLTVVLIEAAGDHPHIKIDATLLLGGTPVAYGSAPADFKGGQTIDVPITLGQP